MQRNPLPATTKGGHPLTSEQKETQLHKILRDLSGERPVTVMSLKAAWVLGSWDGEEIPADVQMLIEDLFKI